MNESEMTLRRLLWLRHGCALHHLYGDDGEMACSTCGIDFKRDPARVIERRFTQLGLDAMEREGQG